MQPRLADDRVGHFVDAVMDLSRDRMVDPYVRYVNRWRLEKASPGTPQSEPVKPITFYIDRSVPQEYRQYVKEGIEAWNKGFERAGFKNAIRAVEAPADSSWSAEDVRYSTVRWTAAYRMGYAIGPSQTDPRTGEILNADILISSGFVQSWQETYEELADPEAFRTRLRGGLPAVSGLPQFARQRFCASAAHMAHQLRFQFASLVGLGVLEGGKPMPVEFLGDAIRELVMHEVGHTLGLRHNFKSSSAIPSDRLNDTSFTTEHGVTASVMDYAPVNVSIDPASQGHYWSKEIGSYDVWAIRYAYTPIFVDAAVAATNGADGRTYGPDSELEHLHAIASEGANPLHAYNTDEDNWLGPFAVDPMTNAWDLGSDPVIFAESRAALVRKVQPTLENRLIEKGESYRRLRDATTSLLVERLYALLPLTKMVGGLHFSRDHKGDPGERPPFKPVELERQRRAVELIARGAFDADAIVMPPDLLNKLAPNRHSHWGVGWGSTPVDYPIHTYVSTIQKILLDELMHPARLQRMLDNEVRMPAGMEPYRVSDLLSALTRSIWLEVQGPGEMAAPIDSYRRNLQLAYTESLIRLLTGTPPFTTFALWEVTVVPVPEHARSLARLELMDLSERIEEILEGDHGGDRNTQSHLAESKARIDRALELSLVRPLQ